MRDKFLEEGGAMEAPKSDLAREYYAQQHAQELAAGSNLGKAQSDALIKLARNEPYYKRNQAHICSFWLKGTCNRGAECPYRHENPPTSADDPLAKQNIKDRYFGRNDPVANKMLGRLAQKTCAARRGRGGLPRCRDGVPGEHEVKTVYVGGIPPETYGRLALSALTVCRTDSDVKDALYAYGEIEKIRVVPATKCAFVVYAEREQAQKAIQTSNVSGCTVKGVPVRVGWARPHVQRDIVGGFVPPEGVSAPAPLTGAVTEKPTYPSMSPAFMGGARK